MPITKSHWRKLSAEIIQRVMRECVGRSEEELKLALREAYPFGERKYHPYKIWLDEIKHQRGTKWPIGHKLAWQNSEKRKSATMSKLLEWEAIYGRRTE